MPFDPKKKGMAYTVGGPVTLYWQDGKHWDHEGNEVALDGTIITPVAKPEPKKPEVGPDPLPAPRKGGKSDDDEPKEAGEKDEDKLEAWAKGEVNIPFYTVKQAVLDKFGKAPNNAVEARKIILGK